MSDNHSRSLQAKFDDTRFAASALADEMNELMSLLDDDNQAAADVQTLVGRVRMLSDRLHEIEQEYQERKGVR